ncbi:TetR/AcrR family transcriptional regulator [Frankia sp. AgB1.9]|uniref:TetR/AcrR family transcriptional regulator n=1 Tax=unclassified Frankia TaxID=2632575 RepID=UPI0019329223|nr:MULTISPECIES: TetR/AcrR family transcriptional regulator [unclassified Frankia]MBL7488485.1 TetR/AcrR family transcriptional regulator [Frankia sp. AgW1.1]MBL7547268.1 TetR/AcrR family transcriptional regulator [Frankia sp. AgB1.9]MBL7620827.1 TetR/AcrR family transcriptional regulator [Frankia sp. AgB1.8]
MSRRKQAAPPRGGHADSASRLAIVDAAARLLAEEGYAAVTTRRIAAKASVTSPLIYYYFGTLDDLLVEVFRRHVDQALVEQARLLDVEQPLWALWDMTRSHEYSAIGAEFVALANHRPTVREAVVHYVQAFRAMQAEAVSAALRRRGADPDRFPAAAVVLLLQGVANVLATEHTIGLDLGHQELATLVERQLREIEGPRQQPVPQLSA